MDKEKTVCFTGPRPTNLHGYSEYQRKRYTAIVNHVAGLVERAYEDGYVNFISGGAQGFDQLAFWAVNKAQSQGLPIRNICYLPFAGQESCWQPNGLFGQTEYEKMKTYADDIKYTIEGKPTEKCEIVRALHHRNHCMVDDSSFVIAMLAPHNRDYRHSSGGTAECVRYAMGKERMVYAIQYLQFLNEPFAGDFLYGAGGTT